MPRAHGIHADHREPVDVHAELARTRFERSEQEARDRAAREAFLSREAKERAAERERLALAAITPVASLIDEERAAAIASFERELAARKWNAPMARLVLLPQLQRRGDGEFLVAFQKFADGAVVTETMPLADAGALLDPKTSPTLRIDEERRIWEKAQEEQRAEQEERRAREARFRRLMERRAAEAHRVRDLVPGQRACVLLAHELEPTAPKVAAAFLRLGEILGADDRTLSALLNRYAEATIKDEEKQS